jgi:hypothetical protein
MALQKVNTSALEDGSIVTANFNDDSITSAKIENGAITNAKINASANISLSKTSIGADLHSISSFTPTSITAASGGSITITGTNFVIMPKVQFLNTSTGARITPNSITFTSSTTLTATFPAGQSTGSYKIIVENPNGITITSSSSITSS